MSRPDVRVVIGVPLYGGAETGHLGGAVASLLAQTYPRVAFVFVDDSASGSALDAVKSIAGHDPRVHLDRNERRLGLVRNWHRVFERARELYPEASYFAWGSDHDRWHPEWLSRLVDELDRHPRAVLAYPQSVRIDQRGDVSSRPWPPSPRREFVAPTDEKIGAGNLVYGLFRSEALAKAGGYLPVYRPDVYLMIELSLNGELRLVPETLWFRRERPPKASEGRSFEIPRPRGSRKEKRSKTSALPARLLGIGPVSRQHRSMFPDGVPLYARLPAPVQHAGLLLWRLAVLGRGRPQVRRRDGLINAARVLGLVAPAPQKPAV